MSGITLILAAAPTRLRRRLYSRVATTTSSRFRGQLSARRPVPTGVTRALERLVKELARNATVTLIIRGHSQRPGAVREIGDVVSSVRGRNSRVVITRPTLEPVAAHLRGVEVLSVLATSSPRCTRRVRRPHERSAPPPRRDVILSGVTVDTALPPILLVRL
jgi:hypothetical protein